MFERLNVRLPDDVDFTDGPVHSTASDGTPYVTLAVRSQANDRTAINAALSDMIEAYIAEHRIEGRRLKAEWRVYPQRDMTKGARCRIAVLGGPPTEGCVRITRRVTPETTTETREAV